MPNLFERNLFDLLETSGSGAAELVDSLAQNRNVRIERIVSTGQSSPVGFWYDQPWAEWVLVMQGTGTVRFEADNRVVTLGPGDHLLIPARARHRVEFTAPDQPTIWLAVFFPEEECPPGTASADDV